MDRLPTLGLGRAVMRMVTTCGCTQVEYGVCCISRRSMSVAASESEVRLQLTEALAVTC
jgi:hypothetical protein